ncbi:hypothetical protein D3C76_968540 [compost metagenome]
MTQAGEDAGLANEGVQAGLEWPAGRFLAGPDLAVRSAHGDPVGQVFLDRHQARSGRLAGQVDDAEAAMADHFENLEDVQPAAPGQRLA